MKARPPFAILSILCLCLGNLACGRTDFSAKSTKTTQSSNAELDNNAEQPLAEVTNILPGSDDPKGEQKPPVQIGEPDLPEVTSLTTSACPGMITDEQTQIVEMSQSSSNIHLNPNSIVILRVAGQAQITLDAKDTASIKGLCIFAAGGSSLTIDSSLVISKMYYYGRGTGDATINFGKTGILQHMDTDISGTHSLAVTGEKLDCNKLVVDQKGTSQVTCRHE